MKACELFEFPSFPLLDVTLFDPQLPAWLWVKNIAQVLEGFDFHNHALPKSIPPGLTIGEHVYIHDSVRLPPYGVIQGPCYIGKDTEIRPGAFIRKNVIIGQRCVIGNVTELKNCLLLNDVKLPHFNYAGDSVLGNNVHFGAGVIASNFRFDKEEVEVWLPPLGKTRTGLYKLGALVGDHVSVGCQTVLQPGTIITPKIAIYPLSAIRGTVLPASPAVVIKRNSPGTA
jgi:NDP-sugar pyrophosphorylase family protein